MIAGFPTRRCCLRISAAVAAVPTTHDFQLTNLLRDSPVPLKIPVGRIQHLFGRQFSYKEENGKKVISKELKNFIIKESLH